MYILFYNNHYRYSDPLLIKDLNIMTVMDQIHKCVKSVSNSEIHPLI